FAPGNRQTVNYLLDSKLSQMGARGRVVGNLCLATRYTWRTPLCSDKFPGATVGNAKVGGPHDRLALFVFTNDWEGF
ncbi:MAG: hypothetical protein ACLQLC_04425, partial [Candidatus Sulfotelmatobacter sp.]